MDKETRKKAASKPEQEMIQTHAKSNELTPPAGIVHRKKMQSYQAENIKVLEGREAVRARPGMYIGDTTLRGLHHLVYEAVDNSIDEALAGHCSRVLVTLHQNGRVSVEDDGRGIPVSIHPKMGKSALTVVLTKLHAGGKFDKDTYKVSGGLHGVGISVANFLSSEFEVWVKREGKIYYQKFDHGKEASDVVAQGDTTETGTRVMFLPDNSIFPDITFRFDTLAGRLRELAFLNKGIEIILLDERSDKKSIFRYEGGINEFVIHLNKGKQTLHPVIYFMKQKDGVDLEIAMQYTSGYQEKIFTFANNINTHEGGTHLSGFKSALTRVINTYVRKLANGKNGKSGGKKNGTDFSGEDVREGITVIISVKVPNPQFEGQTKTKLGNSEVAGIVNSLVTENLSIYFDEHPSEARLIVAKCNEARRAREAARKAKDLARKGVFEGGSLPGKLADCSNRNPAESELFIVEGDSAGGSAKQGRDRKFQAILPLRGKILNVEKARLHRVFENNEIKNMITAIGTGVRDDFNVEKVRYHKIIIATDADVDGSHIRTLLLTFFFRYMADLIDAGFVYIAQPPLYKIKKSKKIEYAYTEREKEALLNDNEKASIQRYKGLGEMNPRQLWETTMDPAHRILKLVTIEDAVESDRIFTLLMGEEVQPRRAFIMEHAKDVVNLDV
jgi:DNA gyrase subunit B